MQPVRSTLALLLLLGALAGCREDEADTEPAASTTTSPAATGAEPEPDPEPARDGGDEGRPAENGTEPDREPTSPQPSEAVKAKAATGAENAYIAYLDAINERDGEALCELLPPGAERELRPAVDQGSCAARIGGSIGYEDPRGYPVFERVVFNGVETASIGRDTSTARLTASILTEFADRDEPSVESDIAYLELSGGEWRLAKPTGALYRAIGRPELPPSVITPP